MPHLSPFALALSMLALSLPALAANHPIVLVHGFLGFGPEQYKDTGFKYWGGFDDIAEHLRNYKAHRQVLVVSVGSISSSWDRSAELYYQLKGGCVDYGMQHSVRAAHIDGQHRPPGKCWAADPANNPHNYPLALYPQWDAAHPLHLIGHSQGGQTIRCLIQLLEQGSPHGDEGGGDLYKGGKVGWVVSATSIASPHDGTSLRDAIGDFAPSVLRMNSRIAAMAAPTGRNKPRPDFKAAQFGLERRAGESERRYLARVRRAPVWNQDDFDSAQFEMGPDGARAFNAWVKASPNVVYLTISNSATEAGASCCNGTDRVIAPLQDKRYQYPRRDMAPLTKTYAGEWIVPSVWRRGIGSYTQSAPERAPVDSRWFLNDGVVNTVSMRAPAGQPVRDYDGKALKGTFNFVRYYDGYDHFDVLGWPRKGTLAYPIYEQVADILDSL
jgi:triacylglycerol lipase